MILVGQRSAACEPDAAHKCILPGTRPFFTDRYAAIKRRNDFHPLVKTFFLWSSPLICPKKGLNFWWRPFFLVFAIDLYKKRPEFLSRTFCPRDRFIWKRLEFLAKTIFFWSAGMVAAHWNLVRTECGPLVQKVADPCSGILENLVVV